MIATQETHTFRHKTYRAHTKYNYRLPYITSISYSRRRYHMCYYTPLKVGKYYIIYYILLCALKIQKNCHKVSSKMCTLLHRYTMKYRIASQETAVVSLQAFQRVNHQLHSVPQIFQTITTRMRCALIS